MLVLSAEALPIGLVRILHHDLLDGNDGPGLLAANCCFHTVVTALEGPCVDYVAVGEGYQHPVRINETLEPGAYAGHSAGVPDDKAEFLLAQYAPAEAVAVSVIILICFAAVQHSGRVHLLLFLESQHAALAQDAVPFEHIEYVGEYVVVAVQTVEGGHLGLALGIHVGNEPVAVDHCRLRVILKWNSVASYMAAAGVLQARGLEDVLLKELLKRRSGDPLDYLGKQIVPCVGVMVLPARLAVGLGLCLAKEAHYLGIAGDPVLLLPEVDEPVRVVEIIGYAARVGEKMMYLHALVFFKLREEFRKLVVKAQQPLPHDQHYRPGGELLRDGCELEYGAFLIGLCLLRVAPAYRAL